jgi:hypothetical protein
MATTLIETRRERLERRDQRKAMTYVITFTCTSGALWWLGRHPFEDVVAGGVGAAFGASMMLSMKRSWRERRRRRGLSIR